MTSEYLSDQSAFRYLSEITNTLSPTSSLTTPAAHTSRVKLWLEGSLSDFLLLPGFVSQ
jgi:hypothetical protein